MTVHEKSRFAQCFNRLAVAVRLPADEADDAMKRVYWEGLNDLPLEAVEDAARELGSTAEWFPKLAEWRQVAGKARNARMLRMALPSPRANPWQAECETCDDSGWEIVACDGQHGHCGRTKEHAAHSYGVACACRPTNRTYQRRLAEQRERSRGRHAASRQRGGGD